MDITFGQSDFVKVSEKYGRRSAIVAEAKLTVLVALPDGQSIELTMDCPIWATLQRDKETQEESVVIEPGLPRGVKVPDTEHSEALKQTVMEHAAVWTAYQSLEDKAVARLTTIPKPGAPAKGKLVRKLTPVATPVSEPEPEPAQ